MKYFSRYNYGITVNSSIDVFILTCIISISILPHIAFLDGKRMQGSNRQHDVDQTNGTQPLKGLFCNIAY